MWSMNKLIRNKKLHTSNVIPSFRLRIIMCNSQLPFLSHGYCWANKSVMLSFFDRLIEGANLLPVHWIYSVEVYVVYFYNKISIENSVTLWINQQVFECLCVCVCEIRSISIRITNVLLSSSRSEEVNKTEDFAFEKLLKRKLFV